MMPKLIDKCAYIKVGNTHMNNILEYAGNKIDKQKIIFSDNSSLEFDNEKKLDLDILQADSKKVHYVILSYKDSYKEKLLSPAQYKKLPSKITVDDTITLVPDLSNKKNNNKRNHHFIYFKCKFKRKKKLMVGQDTQIRYVITIDFSD
ncbi:MAG: hypothetical protein RR654_11310, partial [Oscillospiraceae bacterium]